ncbi:MAG: hypothetical protein J5851_01910 [Oscillospiraceae bacterium]|nr:hypothetical protein [Oscillospiraceae bacterium]
MDNYGTQPNPNGYYAPQNQPISPLGYIGYMILFGLPGIGFLICIIIAIAAQNKNVKNFAIAQIIIVVAAVIISVLVMLICGVSMASLSEAFQSAYESGAAGY